MEIDAKAGKTPDAGVPELLFLPVVLCFSYGSLLLDIP